MKNGLINIGKFLHIVDGDDRLNLSDIAFMIIMAKIAMAPVLDFPAVITLATVLINKMHKRQNDNTYEKIQDASTLSSLQEVKEQICKVKDIVSKVSPVVEQVKEAIK